MRKRTLSRGGDIVCFDKAARPRLSGGVVMKVRIRFLVAVTFNILVLHLGKAETACARNLEISVDSIVSAIESASTFS